MKRKWRIAQDAYVKAFDNDKSKICNAFSPVWFSLYNKKLFLHSYDLEDG